MPKDEAYDIARRELYALRQEEEVERRIAKEEAQFVGAYFGKTRLEVGHELESKEFERWKTWAVSEMARIQAQRPDADTSASAPTAPPGTAGPAEEAA